MPLRTSIRFFLNKVEETNSALKPDISIQTKIQIMERANKFLQAIFPYEIAYSDEDKSKVDATQDAWNTKAAELRLVLQEIDRN